jgi:hypothetical protein
MEPFDARAVMAARIAEESNPAHFAPRRTPGANADNANATSPNAADAARPGAASPPTAAASRPTDVPA